MRHKLQHCVDSHTCRLQDLYYALRCVSVLPDPVSIPVYIIPIILTLIYTDIPVLTYPDIAAVFTYPEIPVLTYPEIPVLIVIPIYRYILTYLSQYTDTFFCLSAQRSVILMMIIPLPHYNFGRKKKKIFKVEKKKNVSEPSPPPPSPDQRHLPPLYKQTPWRRACPYMVMSNETIISLPLFFYRNVAVPGLNDSYYVGLSIYNACLCCAVAVPLSIFNSDSLNVTFTVTTGFIIFCATSILCMLFLPKVSEREKERVIQVWMEES